MIVSASSAESSPHAWGCFRVRCQCGRVRRVFPTRVGVFPARCARPGPPARLPHTRGGVSAFGCFLAGLAGSSPHAWGCFRSRGARHQQARVFPTRVGVFPGIQRARRSLERLPHTRGGVSIRQALIDRWGGSSPHAWGCFWMSKPVFTFKRVFPTRVGVFPPSAAHACDLTRLPHTRGGVSPEQGVSAHHPRSSPHAWGCFRHTFARCLPAWVFPTRVGVFPPSCATASWSRRLPHTRGGVSVSLYPSGVFAWSSPHAWGCFPGTIEALAQVIVFPTRVGVFPRR